MAPTQTLTADGYRDSYLALHACINARVPVILWGPPGQGKTSVITALAKHEGRRLEVLLASIREPQDFAGLPSITNGRTTLVAPDWAQDLAEDGNGILFMDEVNTAPPAVQAALLRVSLDKVVGDCHLGDNTSVIAAANPPELAADGWDLAPPLANRFCHLDWSLPAEVVRDGIGGHWPTYTSPAVEDDALIAALNVERVVFAAFLTARPDLVTALPQGTSEQGRAFPTPRSWETAIKLVAYSVAADLPESTLRVLVRGAVGPGAAAEYLTYRASTDLPDPELLLAQGEKAQLPLRPDQLYAVGLSLINALRNNVDEERWKKAEEIINLMAQSSPDIAVRMATEWLKLVPRVQSTGKPKVMADRTKSATLVPLMVEAGLLKSA